jgi:hypothetical protein
MRKLLLLAALASALSVQAFRPPRDMKNGDSVTVDRGFLGNKFRQDGNLLKPGSVQNVLLDHPESRSDASAARTWTYVALVPAAAGGFMLGWPVGAALAGGDFNAPLFFTGVGVAAVGMALGKYASNRLATAAEKYNAALPAKVGVDGNWTPERSFVALKLSF